MCLFWAHQYHWKCQSIILGLLSCITYLWYLVKGWGCGLSLYWIRSEYVKIVHYKYTKCSVAFIIFTECTQQDDWNVTAWHPQARYSAGPTQGYRHSVCYTNTQLICQIFLISLHLYVHIIFTLLYWVWHCSWIVRSLHHSHHSR
jgi:hypothetical protein